MQHYASWGVDLAIDLEHQMLDCMPSPDPSARDARGWCRLELREGALWAVDVRWTPDGAARLTERRQRYISPAFEVDDAGRVTKIINIAITAMPATHHTPALIAATKRRQKLAAGDAYMDPELIKQAIAALRAEDAGAALDLLEQMLASALGAPADAAPADAQPADAVAASEAPNPDAEQMQAASMFARALTGERDLGRAMRELSRRSEVALSIERRERDLAVAREALELGERRELTAKLVQLGAETPATAWASSDATHPCARLMGEPLESLRSRVEQLGAAKGARPGARPTSRPGAVTSLGRSFATPDGEIRLSADQIARCEKMNVKPEAFAATLARRERATRGV